MPADDQVAFIYVKRMEGSLGPLLLAAIGTIIIEVAKMAVGAKGADDKPDDRCVVIVDGAPVARLTEGDHHRHPVAPGLHTLQVMSRAPKSANATFELQRGETITFEFVERLAPWKVEMWQVASGQASAVVQSTAPRPENPVQTTLKDSPLTVRNLDFIETRRTQEPIGEESFSIDNRKAKTSVERVRAVSQEWSRTGSIAFDEARTADGGVAIGPNWLSLRTTLQQVFQQTYSVETTQKHTVTEQLTVTVPAGASVRVLVAWKLIWQQGVVRFEDQNGQIVEIPYKVAISLTFDQVHEEIE